MLSHDFLFVCVCILIGSYKTASYIGLGPILIISFNLITSYKVLSPNIVTFEVLEVRILPCEFGGNKIQPMTILFFSFCKVFFFSLSFSHSPFLHIFLFLSLFPSHYPGTQPFKSISSSVPTRNTSFAIFTYLLAIPFPLSETLLISLSFKNLIFPLLFPSLSVFPFPLCCETVLPNDLLGHWFGFQ